MNRAKARPRQLADSAASGDSVRVMIEPAIERALFILDVFIALEALFCG